MIEDGSRNFSRADACDLGTCAKFDRSLPPVAPPRRQPATASSMWALAIRRELWRFLKVLAAHEGPVHWREIGIGCSVRQGRARQEARSLGYAIFLSEQWSWAVTPLGRAANPNGSTYALPDQRDTAIRPTARV